MILLPFLRLSCSSFNLWKCANERESLFERGVEVLMWEGWSSWEGRREGEGKSFIAVSEMFKKHSRDLRQGKYIDPSQPHPDNNIYYIVLDMPHMMMILWAWVRLCFAQIGCPTVRVYRIEHCEQFIEQKTPLGTDFLSW